MKRRVFICGDVSFPRGGASSNYIQYFSEALISQSFEVHVVTTKNKEYSDNVYKEVIIHPFSYSTFKPYKVLEFRSGASDKILSILSENNANENDVVILYSQKEILASRLEKYCKKKNIAIGAIVVELYARQDVEGTYNWYLYKKMIQSVLPKYDFLIPISNYIREWFAPRVTNMMVLPIMADPYEYSFTEPSVRNIRNIFVPIFGSSKTRMKDSLVQTLKAVVYIAEKYKGQVCFHFSGIKKTEVQELIDVSMIDLDDVCSFYGWLSYEKLIELYKAMDLFLFPREIRQLTEANFPSKVPELMSYGVVPIATKVGDCMINYLTDGKDCFLFDGWNNAEIVQAIERAIIAQDSVLIEMKKAARKTVEDKFFYGIWADKLGKFIDSMVKV